MVHCAIHLALLELAELGRASHALTIAFERARTSWDPRHLRNLGDALDVGGDLRAHLLAAAARERAAWLAGDAPARAWWRAEVGRLAVMVIGSTDGNQRLT